ncbi:MAG: DUF2911 domain-containing protein [Ignavibacteriaceae bacterium]|nr:DUF2911 domain-containing protein [Ignavibacteriaceae bacterium]
MKHVTFSISLLSMLLFLLSFPLSTNAQEEEIRTSLHASVSQRIGVETDITIDYSRPGVKGRVIWGNLVPYGMASGNEYSNGNPYPWRAGANENTTIEFNTDILIEGQKLSAGKYGIHMIPSEKEWIIIFSNNNSEWGSFSYNQVEDALRITVTPVKSHHQEWLLFGFEELAGNSTTAFLHWENIKAPFKIKLEGEKETNQ